MGKSRNKKANAAKPGSAARYNPYGRQTTRITDLCNMLSAATSSTIKAGEEMEDEERENPAERGHSPRHSWRQGRLRGLPTVTAEPERRRWQDQTTVKQLGRV